MNVAKWEKSMAEDEKEIEKLKKEEKKHVAVRSYYPFKIVLFNKSLQTLNRGFDSTVKEKHLP